jgi:hypothetical protein
MKRSLNPLTQGPGYATDYQLLIRGDFKKNEKKCMMDIEGTSLQSRVFKLATLDFLNLKEIFPPHLMRLSRKQKRMENQDVPIETQNN